MFARMKLSAEEEQEDLTDKLSEKTLKVINQAFIAVVIAGGVISLGGFMFASAWAAGEPMSFTIPTTTNSFIAFFSGVIVTFTSLRWVFWKDMIEDARAMREMRARKAEAYDTQIHQMAKIGEMHTGRRDNDGEE